MIDEQSSASGHDYASYRSAIGAGPTEMGDSRIPDCQVYPGAVIDPGPVINFLPPPPTLLSGPATVVVGSEKGVRSGVMCLGIACSRETLWDLGGVGTCRLVVCDDCSICLDAF